MPGGYGEGFFIGNNDFELFQHFNKEFVEEIVEVPIGYYRTATQQTVTNLYGESPEGEKYYEIPVKLYALIEPDDQETDTGDFTFDVDRNITFGFQRERLKEKELYPQRGDIIEFDHDYYEVDDVIDNKLLGSQWFMRHAIVVNTHVARTTNLTLIDPDTLEVTEVNIDDCC